MIANFQKEMEFEFHNKNPDGDTADFFAISDENVKTSLEECKSLMKKGKIGD